MQSFKALLTLRQVVENTKCLLQQPALPDDSQHSIRNPEVACLYPEGFVTLEVDAAYRLAGGAVGSTAGRRQYLTDLASKYEQLVKRFLSIPLVQKHGALIILILCMRPSTRFNHHLRIFAPSDSLTIAARLRAVAVQALATILQMDVRLFGDLTDPSAALCQMLSSAKVGGLSLPDPVVLAAPVALADLADTLPPLRSDPIVGHLLTDTSQWINSPTAFLAEAAQYFPILVSRSTFTEAQPHTQYDRNPPTIAQMILCPTTAIPVLERLHLLSSRRPQSFFVHAEYVHRHELLLGLATVPGPAVPTPAAVHIAEAPATAPLPTALTVFAHAGIRAASQKGAAALLTAWSIPADTLLSDYALQYFVCARLRLPFPFFQNPPMHCHPRCHFIPPSRPASHSHHPNLFLIAALALHHIACGASGKSLARHNAICRILVKAVCKELGVTPQLIERLHSSTESRRMVDAVVTAFQNTPEHLGIDATVSVSLLPSYIRAAARSGTAIFQQRANEKKKKHEGFSADQTGSKGFLAMVMNHLGGTGPAEWWKWFDAAFAQAVLTELRTGVVYRSAMQRKAFALQKAQSALMRASADMIARCMEDPQ